MAYERVQPTYNNSRYRAVGVLWGSLVLPLDTIAGCERCRLEIWLAHRPRAFEAKLKPKVKIGC